MIYDDDEDGEFIEGGLSSILLPTFGSGTYQDFAGNLYVNRQSNIVLPNVPDLFKGELVSRQKSTLLIETVNNDTRLTVTKSRGPVFDTEDRFILYWASGTDNEDLSEVEVQSWNGQAWQTVETYERGIPGYFVMQYYTTYRIISKWYGGKTFTITDPLGTRTPNQSIFIEPHIWYGGAPDQLGGGLTGVTVVSELLVALNMRDNATGLALTKYKGQIKVGETIATSTNLSQITQKGINLTTTKYRGLFLIPPSTIATSTNLSQTTLRGTSLSITRFNGVSIS